MALSHKVPAALGTSCARTARGIRAARFAGRRSRGALDAAQAGRGVQCSHLGGHRFAANLLVLPHGLCFGRLDPRTAVALVEELEAGRLPLENLRGRTTLEPEQQAAEILIRRELGLTGLGDL